MHHSSLHARALALFVVLGPLFAYGCRTTETSRPASLIAMTGDQPTRVRVSNRCTEPLWIQYGVSSSTTGLGPQNVMLAPGASYDYPIPGGRLEATRFWPKRGCDAQGNNCAIGQSVAPCPTGGCQPPVDSKFEATFADTACGPRRDDTCMTWYNASQVDGYTVPFSIYPKETDGVDTCIASHCGNLDLRQCPADELIGGRSFDLRIFDTADKSKIIGCMSPCKKLNFGPPYGLGKSESEADALYMCCPTPVPPDSGRCTAANGCVTPTECSSGPIKATKFVQYINNTCPSVYAYAYDDAKGLHRCPSTTKFEVVFCPADDGAGKIPPRPTPPPAAVTPPSEPRPPVPGPAAGGADERQVCKTDPRVNQAAGPVYDPTCRPHGGVGCIEDLPCRYR